MEFETLVEQFKLPLVAFLCRLVDDQRDAEDFAVETFLRVYRRQASEGEDSEFAVSLHRVAIDVAVERHHKSSANLETPPAPLDIQTALRHCIAELSETERLAILLHKYQKLTCAQIGSVLSVGETEVTSLLLRAYRTVQNKVQEEGARESDYG